MNRFLSTIGDSILIILLLALVPFAQARLCKAPIQKTDTQEKTAIKPQKELKEAPEDVSDIHKEPVVPEILNTIEETTNDPQLNKAPELTEQPIQDKKQLSQRLHKLAQIIEQLETVVKEFESLETTNLDTP